MAQVTLTERDGGVLLLTADRPPANAMDVSLLDELVAAVGGLAADPPAALVMAGREGLLLGGRRPQARAHLRRRRAAAHGHRHQRDGARRV
jgi:enoyl-CoA hydratase/carnithine racemase